MEQLTPIYDSTAAESYFSFNQMEKLLSDSELLLITQRLSATLDLQWLINDYFELLKGRLDLGALEFRAQQFCINLGAPQGCQYFQLQDCRLEPFQSAQIKYHFQRAVGGRDIRLLNELHECLQQPLKNALCHAQLKSLATKDHLTGLGNRASFDECMQRHLGQMRRHGHPFGLMVLDMNKFKAINDRYGHGEGDLVLIATAQAISGSLRETDYAFRFGGDEFCCLIEEADSTSLLCISQRIHRAMAQDPLLARHRAQCAIGMAKCLPEDNAISLFQRADEDLYRAKQTGNDVLRFA
ncbi:GGDEF domain-containing protein [Aliiglaciecola sp. CAU 1673]|uniref:GGDEF domain-containing protein n=1 Tax=Aliiglaciecola sp. CAU 1673 TaxID=3032595 RepID=UPI0023DC0E87|nr:GGDEF domain-containing protein [Aliiglaciecola sp. CAU 1673]MDF2179607.1 GGDEF domain-containing protein [Aliiglaciecola sp. CAU 1673]